MTDFLSSALEYAELGYLVFPLLPGGKKPITGHGLKDATTDESQIEAWWNQYPAANIGLLTSGLLVVDIDGSKNAWLSDNPERALELAVAPCSLTPSGGRHYVFRQPSGKYRNTAGKLAPKVDTRADGGYIVVPPSILKDKSYQWASELESSGKLPLPPAWLLEALSERVTPSVEIGSNEAGNIPSGQRNATLSRLGGTMRRVGMGESEILAALSRTNLDRCKPPMKAAEVAMIAKSMARYEPNQIATAVVEDHFGQMATSGQGPVIVCMDDVEPRQVDWLWQNRIAAGRITLLVGMPGLGKSYLTCDMASRISTGTPWPDGSLCEQGSVLLITGEDDPHDTIRPRLDAHEANVKRIHLLSAVNRLGKNGQPEEFMFSLADVEALRTTLAQLSDCRLVICDPIGSFLGGGTDAHRDNEVRSVLAPVAKIAEQSGAAVLMVAHRRKGGGNHADDLALGSRAFTGIARSVWHLSQDTENPDRRLLLPGKNNLAMQQQGLAFSIEGEPIGRLTWEDEPVDMSADDAVKEEFGIGEKKRGPKPTRRMQAIMWLRDALANGPRLAKELIEEATQIEKFSKGTIDHAKAEIKIKSYRTDIPGPWLWELPSTPKDDAFIQTEFTNNSDSF